jgi:tetratricopeptide (TPR) repeat protein
VAIDRTGTLRNAEKLLRQGRVDAAIAEYVRVVEDNSRDWNTANILGDLYVRLGRTDQAVEQFIRIADSLNEQGFLPKAAALYKKILKLKPDDEHAMLQAGAIAAQQGFYADARAYLGAVMARRSARGDTRGSAEVRIRLGSLDPADFDARIAAANARIGIEDVSGAVRDLVQIAADLFDKQRYADAVKLLDRAAALAPDEEAVQNRVHDVLLTIADARLRAGSVEEGLAIAGRVLDGDASQREAIAAIGWNIAAQAPDAGLLVIELAIRSLVAQHEWTAAVAVLQELVARVPRHVPALMRLVEICVDGELETMLASAQAQLADAYLAAGQASEARYIAEDLVGRQPSESAHVERLRRTLVLLGERDPDGIIAERLSAQSSLSDADLPEEEAPSSALLDPAAVAAEIRLSAPSSVPPAPQPEAVPSIEPPPVPTEHEQRHGQRPGGHEQTADLASEAKHAPPPRRLPVDVFELSSNAVDIQSIIREFDSPPQESAPEVSEDGEVDLSVVLDGIERRPQPGAGAGREQPKKSLQTLQSTDIEDVFVQLRDEASRRSALDGAEQEFRRALALKAAGDIDGCIDALQSASKAPSLRFGTASLLGRLFRERGLMSQAAEWYERAAQAPAPTPADYHVLLFELAEVLEAEGEIIRALAVCLELQADAGDYRDVATRVDRLAKVQARG